MGGSGEEWARVEEQSRLRGGLGAPAAVGSSAAQFGWPAYVQWYAVMHDGVQEQKLHQALKTMTHLKDSSPNLYPNPSSSFNLSPRVRTCLSQRNASSADIALRAASSSGGLKPFFLF